MTAFSVATLVVATGGGPNRYSTESTSLPAARREPNRTIANASYEDRVPVTNSTRSTITLWVWEEKNKRYRKPPMHVHPGTTKYLELSELGAYRLVARDAGGRDFHLGRFNFHELLQLAPNGKFDLAECTRCHALIETRSYVCPYCGRTHYYQVHRNDPDPDITGHWNSDSEEQ